MIKKNYHSHKKFTTSKQRIFHDVHRNTLHLIIGIGCGVLLLGYTLKHEHWGHTWTAYFWETLDSVWQPFVQIKENVEDKSKLLQDKKELLKENQQLKKKLQESEAQYFEHEALIKENTYLRALAPMVKDKPFQTLTMVKKIAFSQPFMVLSYVSPEVCQRVQEGAPVLSPAGLIGLVLGVGQSKVLVRLVTHVQSRIVVVGEKSKRKAILFGQNSPIFRIKYVVSVGKENGPYMEDPQHAVTFEEGETLLTDTSTGDFLHSIPVAKMVRNEQGDLQAQWTSHNDEPYMTVVIEEK